MAKFLPLLCLCTACAGFAVESRLSFYPALMDTLVAGDYAAADRICDSIGQQIGMKPEQLYAQMAVIYARFTDFEDTVGRAELLSLADSCTALTEAELEQPGVDLAMLHYLRGSCIGTVALLWNHEGSSIRALRHLMRSRDEYARAIETDPEFYDAYLGRGAYRYGVATHASAIGFLPFMPSRQSGWSDMWLAVERSRFSKWSALTALVWFAIEDQNLEFADSICAAGLERFPGCRGFLWPKLSIEMRREAWAAAESIAVELFQQYDSLGANAYDRIGLCLQISNLKDRLGSPTEARAWAQRGLLIPHNTDISKRRKQKLQELSERAERP